MTCLVVIFAIIGLVTIVNIPWSICSMIFVCADYKKKYLRLASPTFFWNRTQKTFFQIMWAFTLLASIACLNSQRLAGEGRGNSYSDDLQVVAIIIFLHSAAFNIYVNKFRAHYNVQPLLKNYGEHHENSGLLAS